MILARLLSTVEDMEKVVNPYLNSATSGTNMRPLGEIIGDAIIDAIVYIAKLIEPLVDGGLRVAFMIFFLSAMATQDKKSGAKALRIFIIYFIYCGIMGAL